MPISVTLTLSFLLHYVAFLPDVPTFISCELTFAGAWFADRTFVSSPSVQSLKKAMQTYARQGGTSTIFVHDDGLQLISEEDRQERITFYSGTLTQPCYIDLR